jgi:hypothetical protein
MMVMTLSLNIRHKIRRDEDVTAMVIQWFQQQTREI